MGTEVMELLLRFRIDPSSPGEVFVGDACCGDRNAAPGGSKAVPDAHDMLLLVWLQYVDAMAAMSGGTFE